MEKQYTITHQMVLEKCFAAKHSSHKYCEYFLFRRGLKTLLHLLHLTVLSFGSRSFILRSISVFTSESVSVFKAFDNNPIAISRPLLPKSELKVLLLFVIPLNGLRGSMQTKFAGYFFDLLESITAKR